MKYLGILGLPNILSWTIWEKNWVYIIASGKEAYTGCQAQLLSYKLQDVNWFRSCIQHCLNIRWHWSFCKIKWTAQKSALAPIENKLVVSYRQSVDYKHASLIVLELFWLTAPFYFHISISEPQCTLWMPFGCYGIKKPLFLQKMAPKSQLYSLLSLIFIYF